MRKKIQFHWRLIQGGEPEMVTRARQLELDSVALPDIAAQAAFCRLGETSGIESMLTDISFGKPDPMLLASGIAAQTATMKFLVAIKSGIISPTYFVQQVNSFSAIAQGRILLNVVAGHSPEEQEYYGDFLPHDERYARTGEFLAVCNAFWKAEGPVDFDGKYYRVKNGQLRTPFVDRERTFPYTFIAGGSVQARDLAIAQGSCWMRLADTPDKIRQSATEVLEAGKEMGLRMSIIARKTKSEALDAASLLLEGIDQTHREKEKEGHFIRKSDSVMMAEMNKIAETTAWLTPWLWTGAVKTYGAPSIAFVGAPKEIAQAILEYREAGVTQYILSGWPKAREMVFFGEEIIPLVRKME